MKKCEKCNAENADSASFCTSCGNTLQTTVTETATPFSTPVTPVASAAPAAPAKTDSKTIALIVVAIVGLAVGICGIAFALTNKGDDKKKDDEPTTSEVEPSGNGTTVATTPVSGNTDGAVVPIGPYNVVVPRSLQYESDGSKLALTDSGNTWVAYVEYYGDVYYSTVKAHLSDLKTSLESQGMTNVATGVSTAAGVEYLYADMTEPTQGMQAVMAVFKAGSNVFQVTATDGTANHAILNYVAPILKDAKQGKTASRDFGFGIDGSKLDGFKTEGAIDDYTTEE
jgi:hypothetical protein